MEITQPARKSFAAICLALTVVTFILYWPVRHDGFINLDDGSYITENAHVTSGLSWSNIEWSFTHAHAGYWMPLTWISHMVDCQLFGLDAGPHHLMSVLIHIANTLLLFWWLNQLTGALWRSAFVAAVFAWHPLRVESVAWACERKDVLSAFFWMLTLIAYARYVKAKESHEHSQSISNYTLALLFFACALMSKPMVVTLPFVILLVDLWPLGRVKLFMNEHGIATRTALPHPSPFPLGEGESIFRLILEKIPFFMLAMAECAVTFLAESAVKAVSNESLLFRLTNSLWGYMRYLSKIFWPFDLAVFYTLPSHVLIGPGIVAALVLAAFSLVSILLLRRRPYLFAGWFWFLGTLVPVIGLARIGGISLSDRYTYLPCIGLSFVLTWGLADLSASPLWKKILAPTAIAVLAACLVLTSIQISYWRDSVTLFRHALAVTKDDYVAIACLGQALEEAGDPADALKYCEESVRLDPNYPAGQFFLGMAFWETGHDAEALKYLGSATEAMPNNPRFQYNLGKFLLEHGQPDKALVPFNAAINDDPDFAEAHNALGKVDLKQGKLPQAASELSQAVTLERDNAQFHYDFGTVLMAASQSSQAISQFSEALRLKPHFAEAQKNLAVALASQGKLDEAIPHFLKVVQLQPNDPDAWFNLGFAYLNNHQPTQAAAQFSQELRLTPNETKAHYRLAQALAQQNKLPEAVSEYHQTLRLTPDFPEAKKELADILATHPQLH